MLLEHAAREQHDGLRAIEGANLRGVQVGDAHDLGARRGAAADERQEDKTGHATQHHANSMGEIR